MKDTYLSIDLDYWATYEDGSLECGEDCTRFFKKVMALGLPIKVVRSHEELLPHVNRSGCRHLINLDHHSDISDLDKNGRDEYGKRILNDGTWVNFVSFQGEGTFTWRYPNRFKCLHRQGGGGRCDVFKNPFTSHCTGWKETKLRSKWARMDFSRIKAIGVAVSPDYIRCSTVQYAIGLFPAIAKWIPTGPDYAGEHAP